MERLLEGADKEDIMSTSSLIVMILSMVGYLGGFAFCVTRMMKNKSK